MCMYLDLYIGTFYYFNEKFEIFQSTERTKEVCRGPVKCEFINILFLNA